MTEISREVDHGAPTGAPPAGRGRWSLHRPRARGWFVTLVLIPIVASAVVYFATGRDALGAAARFVWNGLVVAIVGAFELLGGLLGSLARGFGMKRLSRIAAVVAGVGLGYAGSVIMSEHGVHRAYGWRARLAAAVTAAHGAWTRLHLAGKLAVVAALIASQVYLHALLIVFPIAFLVPVVRNLWVQTADLVVGKWYWRKFGAVHRSVVASLRRMPVVRQLIGAARVTRIRYLCAWRMWRYDPRYRTTTARGRRVSLVEPVVLWWRGELDRYIGQPLLAGPSGQRVAG